jgi:hypothetical protein
VSRGDRHTRRELAGITRVAERLLERALEPGRPWAGPDVDGEVEEIGVGEGVAMGA